MYNAYCIDCEIEGHFHFRNPSPGWAGWFGGCGEFLCTAPDNVMVTDHTGTYLKKSTDTENIPRQAMSHNYNVAGRLKSNTIQGTNNDGYCDLIENWNDSYLCEHRRLVTLEFEAIEKSNTKRMHAPVYMRNPSSFTKDGDKYIMEDIVPSNLETFRIENKINAFREWEWDGPEPLNKRQNRFIAVVEAGEANINYPSNDSNDRATHGVYDVDYNGLNPAEIIHKIQHRHPYKSHSSIPRFAEEYQTLFKKTDIDLWNKYDSDAEDEGTNLFVIFRVKYQVPLSIVVINNVDGTVIKPYLPEDSDSGVSHTNLLDTKYGCGSHIYDF